MQTTRLTAPRKTSPTRPRPEQASEEHSLNRTPERSTPVVRTRPEPGIERLYVGWIVSIGALVLLVAIVTLFGAGHLRRQAEAITGQAATIEALTRRVQDLENQLNQRGLQERPASASPSVPSTHDDRVQLSRTSPPPDSSLASRPATAMSDAELSRQLDKLLGAGGSSAGEASSSSEAAQLVDTSLRDVDAAAWSGSSLARLALLAAMNQRGGPAELFAERAERAGTTPRAYYEYGVRSALRDGSAAEALRLATRLAAKAPRDGVAQWLLAAAHALSGDYAAAAEAQRRLRDLSSLPPADLIDLGWLLVDLENWARVDEVVAALGAAKSAGPSAASALRAMQHIQRRELNEALAILEELLIESPDDYRLNLWRGVALLESRQYEAARAALRCADSQPARPQGWYWLGVAELRSGRPQEAAEHFEHALRAASWYAPAWEALARQAMDRADAAAQRGDADTAHNELSRTLELVSSAVEANPRRATPHLLAALVYAKVSRSEQAARALSAAFALDPSLLETAKSLPVITRLLAADELDALAMPVASQPASSGSSGG